MNSSLSSTDLNSASFESIFVECYRRHYIAEGYRRIPDSLKELSGISGYTSTGKVHTCLYSDYFETFEETCLHQCEHMARSIEKLMNNPALFLEELKIPKVYEWHLNVYEYLDARILIFMTTKRNDTRKAIAENPEKYSHISENVEFRIIVPDNYIEEIRLLLFQRFHKKHIHIKPPKEITTNFIPNAEFKAKVKKFTEANDEDVDSVVNVYSNYYSVGLLAIAKLKCENDKVHRDILSLAELYKDDIFIKSRINFASNHFTCRAMFDEFYEDFNENFGSLFTKETLLILKRYFLVAWILDGTVKV